MATNFREKTDKATSYLKENAKTILTNVSVVVLAVFFVFYNTLSLSWTNLNPWILLIRSILAIVVGIMIKSALGENGFDRGYRSKIWTDEFTRYELKADEALPYIDKVDAFYEKQKNEKTLKNRKTRLSGYRMKYDTFFDANGDYIEHEIWSPRQKKRYLKTHKELPSDVVVLDIRQRICLFKCVRLKIYVKNIFSEYETGLTVDERKEKTDKMQRAYNLRKNTFKSVAFALSGVYVVASFAWNIGALIVAIFQVVGFIVVGLLDALSNYYYVTTEKVAILRDKESDIAKFLIEIEGRDVVKEKFEPKPEPQQPAKIVLTKEQAAELFKNTTGETKNE